MAEQYSPSAVLDELNENKYASLIDAFDNVMATSAARIAYSCVGTDTTFAEVGGAARAIASYLTNDLGLQKGDRIAIQLPNITQYPIIAWGAMLAGVILVNTNPLYTEREMLHQFNDSGAKVWAVIPSDVGLVEKIKQGTGIEHVIFVGIPGVDGMALAAERDWATAFERAIGTGMAQPFTPPEMTMDDIAVLQYTGGTTGLSKGAILTHGNLFSSIRMAEQVFNMEDIVARGILDRELMIAPMPVYHVYGFTVNILGVFLRGGQSVLVPDPRDIDGLVKTMAAYPFTSMAGINTLYAGILQHPELEKVDFSNVLGVVAGGAALMSDIAHAWEAKTGTVIIEGYGLSETASNLCCNKVETNKIGSVGQNLVGMQVKTVDDEGHEITDNETPGELLVRGPHVMKGYWGQEEATKAAIDADGWFRTGDVAVIHPDGFVEIVDRIKDMIIVSGFNVYPNEIEDVVSTHPKVVECAVISIPCEHSGEAVKLFVVANTDTVTAEELDAHCRQSLTAYKCPKEIEFIDELPKTAVGKILRRELRERDNS